MTDPCNELYKGMTKIGGYDVLLTDPQNRDHPLRLTVFHLDDGEHALFTVRLEYTNGALYGQTSNLVAEWQASRCHASPYGQAGSADVGGGDRRLPEEWRGSGLGTLLQSLITILVKMGQPVQLAEIIFSRSDVLDLEKKVDDIALARRSKFWGKFGFKFDLSDDGSYGTSQAKFSDTLIVPSLQEANARGWKMKLPDALKSDFGLSVKA